MKNSIKKVAITGGTHGNELTGVYLINKFLKNPDLVKRSNFETISMHTNLGAMKRCTRYVDKDLNRSFALKDLNDQTLCAYEDILAKNINQKLGPRGSQNPNVDFIIDLHSTTSDMGLSVIIDTDNKLVWNLAKYLKLKDPKVNIFKWIGDTGDASFVYSIAKNGFVIEVGPIPQGVLRADLFFATEKLIQDSLDFFEKYNSDTLEPIPEEVEVYDNVKLVDFPRDKEGDINATVHPNLQDKGYVKLSNGDPLFVDLDGNIIYFKEAEDMYALFVNEAAYYEKGFAMCLAKKKTIKI